MRYEISNIYPNVIWDNKDRRYLTNSEIVKQLNYNNTISELPCKECWGESASFNPKLQNSILYEEDTLPNNFGTIKAREALDKVHNGEKDYKPDFIEEMAEIREEIPVRVSGYDDLFDREKCNLCDIPYCLFDYINKRFFK